LKARLSTNACRFPGKRKTVEEELERNTVGILHIFLDPNS
jgi:hypothetical protein